MSTRPLPLAASRAAIPSGTTYAPGQSFRLPRLPELDALRGLFLVWMTLAHLPTHLSDLVNQPFGFVSSAEGFIFLSALLVGRIYIRKARENSAAIHRKLWKRSLRLYGYQLGLLAVAFTAAGAFAVMTHRPALYNLLNFYLAHPGTAILGSLLLVYCPPLLDILPMYIVLLALSPTILSVAARRGWSRILIASGAVWLLAQFGLRSWVHSALVSATGLNVPLSETGAFNIFAWQALWIVAMWIGARSSDIAETAHRAGKESPKRTSPYLLAASTAICLFFMAARHDWFGASVTPQTLGMLMDKWQLGSLRVVNMAAFGYLVFALRRWLSPVVRIEPLLVLGKSSLEVFCAHLVFVFGGLALLYGSAEQLHGATATSLVAITFAALIAVALWMRARRAPGPLPPTGLPTPADALS